MIFDLLGDPIPEGWGKRGRPAHVVTPEKRQIVVALCAFGKTETEIAAALAITEPTLRKHYFREMRERHQARQRLEAKLVAALLKAIEEGNASAVDKMFKRLDRADVAAIERAIAARGPARGAALPVQAKKGKKEQRRDDALDVRGLYEAPQAPRLN